MRYVALSVALIVACSPRTAETPGNGAALRSGGLDYTAETRILESFPVQLHTEVGVRNPGNQTVRLELPGGCPVILQAYASEDRTRLVWDQSRVLICTLQLLVVDLAPGAERSFTGRTDAREVLGDSLPDGVYHFSAQMSVNGSSVLLPAGSAQLAVPR